MIGANAVLVFANAAELDRRNMDAQTLELGDVLAPDPGGMPEGRDTLAGYAGDRSLCRQVQRHDAAAPEGTGGAYPLVCRPGHPLGRAGRSAGAGRGGSWASGRGRTSWTVSDPGAAAVLSEFGQVVSRCDQYQAEREGALILSETGVKELWGCLHP